MKRQILKTNMTIPKRIRQARKEAKLLQRELAEKAGLTRVSISSYEKGVTTPNPEHLDAIGKVLDIDFKLGKESNVTFE